MLTELGHCVEKLNIIRGDQIPTSIERYRGVVIFGGTMNAESEQHPELKMECRLIEKLLKAGVPTIGVCLGGQLISKVLGRIVEPHPEGAIEIGFQKIYPTSHSHPLFSKPMFVYQWHRDDMKLPDGAKWLAHSDLFPIQAYEFGKALALQFHPDATLQTIRAWCELGKETLSKTGAQSAEFQCDFAVQHEKQMECWTRALLSHSFAPA
ncbi:glutamine amidotransferase-related protein [Kordiimonas aestuarii]|uniref:glutamine amidotransferase-related protein n=1 Tax=Kordiimonas aestuarii TaxID=1005925 RepID=UPI0021CF8233|nr:hypothetical protein [Kordiimonas aestuarii]